MALSEASTREALAQKFGELGAWIGVYTSGGTSEASGGSPAYARKQTVWTAGAVDGTVTGSQVEIDLPGGTYTHFGVFTAATGGTLVHKGTITSKTLDDQGKLLVTPSVTVS